MKTNFSALFRSVVICLALLCATSAVYAVGVAPLDPNSFASLGANPFTTNGTYTIDTRGTAPVLLDPSTNTVATGVQFNGIAVFTFDNIVIGTNTTVQGIRNAGSQPYALLSHGDLTIEGTVDASGANGGPAGLVGGSGGAAGPGGGGGGGGGAAGGNEGPGPGGVGLASGSNGGGSTQTSGAGGNGGNVAVTINGEGTGGGGFAGGGGGAFGGNGGNGKAFETTPAGIGGTAYGDLTVVLQAGSGGGGGGPFEIEGQFGSGAGGGGGGGTVELACLSNAFVSGTVSAKGGNSGSSPGPSGGGGAGGGILFNVAGNITLLNTGRLSAAGGGAGDGGSGGGGRINIIATIIDVQGTGVVEFVNVAGGLADPSFGGTGSNGVLTVAGTVCPEFLTVTNTADSGPGSLRQAILDASACPVHHTINFDPAAHGTITLTSGELLVTSDLDILGPGATNLAVNGNAASSVFHVSSNIVVTIAGLTVINGFASPKGGGIYNDHSTLTVSNCTISHNVAAFGTGIENDGQGGSATLTVVNSTISSNQSSGAGAGIRNDGDNGDAMVTIANSTVSGNFSDNGGGGIFNRGVTGGSATLIIENTTFSENSATTGPGGILNVVSGGGSAATHIGSTILDAGGTGTNLAISGGTITSDGYNLSSDDGGGFLNQSTDLVNTNALLGPLQLNGGQTATHALLCGSPAIDAGTNFTGSATDQRGLPRTVVVAGIVNGGDGTDIGAIELQAAPICNHPPVAICSNTTVSADNNCMATVNVSDINNGSSDPDSGDSITLSFNSSSVVSSTTLSGTGAHTVTLYVTDTHGAQDSCEATVTVADVTPPDITACPGPQTNSANASCQANVPNFTTGVTASDNCSAVTVSQSPAAGTPVGLGTTSVAIYVVDAAGNTNNTCTTSFTVKDTTPPTITCPPNQTVNATMPSGAVVNYPAAVASDNCGVISSLTYSKNSGTVFPIGTTTVTSRAIDNSSNTNTCTFTVKVKSASEQITDLMALVNGLPGVKAATKNALVVKLNAAQSALRNGNTALACSSLKDFISLASSQAGKKELTTAQANMLIAQATRIRAALACP